MPTPEPPKTSLRYGLQVLLAVQLVFLALLSRGVPGGDTLLHVGLLVTLVSLWRALLSRHRSRWMMPTLGLFIVVASQLLPAGWGGPAATRSDPYWVAWVAFPVALLLDPQTRPPGQVLSLPRTALLLGALLIAVLPLEVWERPGSRALLAVATLTALVLLLISISEWQARRSSLSPARLPGGTTFALFIAVLTLSLAFLLHRGLNTLSGIARSATEQEKPGFLSRRWDSLGLADLVTSMQESRTIASVRPSRLEVDRQRQPRPLFLLEHVLDHYKLERGTPYLVRSSGNSKWIRDGDDGLRNQRVTLHRVDGDLLQLHIRRPDYPTGPRFAEPLLAWSSGTALQLQADQSLWAEQPDPEYVTASLPEAYFARQVPSARVTRQPAQTQVPKFADREWLLSQARQWLPPSSNDLQSVRRLAQMLQQTGTWQIPPDWTGSYRTLLEGSRAALCIHFAQTAALLCRLAGFPARIAVGYLGREWDAVASVFWVRSRNRHAWLEVRFEELGWIAFDVTPPRRTRSTEFLEEDPSLEEEPALAAAAGQAGNGTQASKPGLLIAVVALLLLLAFLLRREAPLEREASFRIASGRSGWKYFDRLEQICQRRGVQRHPCHTGREFIQQLMAELPQEKGPLGLLLRCYHSCRFGQQTLAAEDEANLVQLLKRLPKALRRRSQIVAVQGPRKATRAV
jgi:hypothetical protein